MKTSAYIEASPEWKRDVGRRLDALIEGEGWFLEARFAAWVKQASLLPGERS